MTKRVEIGIATISIFVALIALLFGDNIFQQITGYSINSVLLGTETPTATIEQVKILHSGNYKSIADYYRDWSLSDKGYIQKIYCFQKVKLANPTEKPTAIINFSSTVIYSTGNVEFDGNGNSIISADVYPDLPFSHIESQLLSSDIVVTMLLDLDLPPDQYESTPEFSFVENVPTATPNPDITSSVSYKVGGEVLSLPLRMESASIVEANILTTFTVDYYAYQFVPEFLDGFNLVSIRNRLTTINGQEIFLQELPCYYVKSK